MTTINIKKTNVAIDLDNVLTTCANIDKQQESFFRDYGAVFELEGFRVHYVFPGVIELIQRLFQETNIRVSFFSAGSKERNKLFVKKLLKTALGKDHYKAIKNDVCILSRDDLSRTNYCQHMHRETFFGLEMAEQTKDISQILRPNDDLEDAILIDDRYENAAEDQIKNLLFSPASTLEMFESLPSKVTSNLYSRNGYRPLNYVLFTGENLDTKGWVKNSDVIGVLKKDETFELHFLDKKNDKYKTHTLQKDNHEELFLKLEELCTSNQMNEDMVEDTAEDTAENTIEIDNDNIEIDDEIIDGFDDTDDDDDTIEIDGKMITIEDPVLTKSIRELVSSQNGKTKRLCRQANRVVYIAGFLFKALEKAKKTGIPVTEILFKRQFTYVGQHSYQNKFRRVTKKDSFYIRGLNELRKVNSDFKLLSPYDYTAYVDTSDDR